MRTVIVTGASRGIGRAIALAFAEKGCDAAAIYRSSDEKMKTLLQEARQLDGEISAYKCDVSKHWEVKDTVDEIISTHQSIDVLVNNAGIYNRVSFQDLTPEMWSKTLETNLYGVYHMTKAAVPNMTENKRGKIVNIGSQLAFIGSVSGADYAASKSALLGFTRSLARELAPHNITANVVAPGAIDTDIIAGDSQEKRKQREEQIPLGRVGKPGDVAGTVVFLASKAADHITGQVIHVNGGFYMG